MGSNKLKEIVATWADCPLLLLNAHLTYAFLSLHLCVFVSTNIRRWWRLPSANLLHLHPAAVRCAFIIWMAKVCTRKPPCLFPLALNERFFFYEKYHRVVLSWRQSCCALSSDASSFSSPATPSSPHHIPSGDIFDGGYYLRPLWLQVNAAPPIAVIEIYQPIQSTNDGFVCVSKLWVYIV